jgi:hypothetical protein
MSCAAPKWGGFRISPNGAHKVLRRHGLNTKAKRLGLVAGYAPPAEPIEPEPQPERHIAVDRPGELVYGVLGRSRALPYCDPGR